MTYTYYTVTGKVVDGEIVVNLKGRQVKLYGSNFVLVAVKTIEGLRTRNVLRCSLMKKGTPMYKATATIYVVSRNDSVLNFSDLQVGSELTSDYIKVFEMWEVHEKVISNLDLDYTYTDMASMLSVTNTSDTRMLDITVTNPDPEEAAAIANEYADVGAKYISEKMKTDEPTLMSSARVPENPFSPNKAKNILLGFVVGFVLACAVVVLRTMLDDTYKSADDIRKYTGMVVLASIPLADAGEQPKEKSEFKRRTKRFANDVRRRVGGSSGRKA